VVFAQARRSGPGDRCSLTKAGHSRLSKTQNREKSEVLRILAKARLFSLGEVFSCSNENPSPG